MEEALEQSGALPPSACSPDQFSPLSSQGGLIFPSRTNLCLHDSPSNYLSMSCLHLDLIGLICNGYVLSSNGVTVWCTSRVSISRGWGLMLLAACGMSGSGAYLTFPLRFSRGYSSLSPSLWSRCCESTAVHQIRAFEEECCFRWWSFFPSASGEHSFRGNRFR